MSPRHFANYRKNDPEGYRVFSDSMHNTFVSFTHIIGLKRFFSFTPPLSGGQVIEQKIEGNRKDYKPTHKDLYK
jgi:hypothetical protein